MNQNIIIHRAKDRGEMKLDWLHSKFSFSFASWYEPSKTNFGKLRVINDDIIAPSSGFGFHSHQNMEIVTIVFSGELTHKDSMGNNGIIKEGDVQRMSAGTGVIHSEYNYNKTDKVKLFQIWILPEKINIKPSYEQKKFNEKESINKFQLLVSPNGQNNSIIINQNSYFSIANLKENYEIKYEKYKKENIIYTIVIEGKIDILNETLNKRDAFGITNLDNIKIKAKTNCKILIIEIPR